MSLYKSGDRILKWRYCTTDLQILIPGEEAYQLPSERLSSLAILNDYENNAYPVFRIELVLEPSLYYKILDNKNDVQFHLRIQKYYHLNDSSTSSLKRDCINDTFNLILDDEASDLSDVTKRKKYKYNFKYVREDDTNDLENANNKLEFFLFKSSTIRGMSNKNVNAVLKDCTVTDAISYVLSTADVRNVLMSPPHNTTVYDNIVIPPMSCIRAMRFLDSYYGIYRTGSLMFFGLDYSYILQYDGACTAYRTNEIQNTQIIIPASIEDHTTECCTLSKDVDATTNYIVADYRSLQIIDASITNDIVSANNVEFIDDYSGQITKNTSSTDNDTPAVKIQENTTENDWLGQTYVAQASAMNTVVNVLLMDYDIDMVTPNKKFNLVFEDTGLTSKYNGVYMLTSINHKFIKDGSDFSITSMIQLKKTK